MKYMCKMLSGNIFIQSIQIYEFVLHVFHLKSKLLALWLMLHSLFHMGEGYYHCALLTSKVSFFRAVVRQITD